MTEDKQEYGIVPQQNGGESVALTPSSALPSLERMRERVEQQREMRQILLQYVRSEMDPDRHFYTIGDAGKPALSQDGARNLCSLYEVRVGDTIFDEVYSDDGHYRCKATVTLYSMANGVSVGTGAGSCSTRESKYAYRWVFAREVPRHLDKADLKTRSTRKGGVLYRIPNEDLADQYNTVLKMAEKRAMVAAALRLPLVSEIFDAGEEEDEDAAEKEAVLRGIGKLLRVLPTKTRSIACQAIFDCAPSEMKNQSIDDLDLGAADLRHAIDAKINWQSETLADDLQALRESSAQQAMEELFPNRPHSAADFDPEASAKLDAEIAGE